MLTKDVTFTGLNDETVNILLQKLLQNAGFYGTGIFGVFQHNTITIIRQNLIDSLYDMWKNIVRQIGGNDIDVF